MEAKSFAVGVRAEHPQEMIDQAQYGRKTWNKDLPSSPYKLTAQTKSGRGSLFFLHVPGGYVVNASSEPGRLAVNGMSYSGRRRKCKQRTDRYDYPGRVRDRLPGLNGI